MQTLLSKPLFKIVELITERREFQTQTRAQLRIYKKIAQSLSEHRQFHHPTVVRRSGRVGSKPVQQRKLQYKIKMLSIQVQESTFPETAQATTITRFRPQSAECCDDRHLHNSECALVCHAINTRYPHIKSSHPQVLGVPRGAGAEEIKKSYRKLVLRYHPDKNQEASARYRSSLSSYHLYYLE